jgi:hypothetical protein
MRRLFFIAAYAIAGYVLGVIAGLVLVSSLSTNTHDRSVEAAMTAAFVVGPVGAFLAALFGLVRLRR